MKKGGRTVNVVGSLRYLARGETNVLYETGRCSRSFKKMYDSKERKRSLRNWARRQSHFVEAPLRNPSGNPLSASALIEEEYSVGVIPVSFLNWREKY